MEHALLLVVGLVIIGVILVVLHEFRLIAQSMEKIAETSSRSERISAKVLTMLAGIEAEDQ